MREKGESEGGRGVHVFFPSGVVKLTEPGVKQKLTTCCMHDWSDNCGWVHELNT